jgi:hypothetical protein
MANIGYFSTYARFETESKEAAAAFLGADNIIGDAFTIESEYVDGKRTAYIVNPFGKRMGFVSEKTAEQVDLCTAKGWTTVALLALVAFSEKPAPGLYWGQVLIVSYDPQYEAAFSTFVSGLGKQLGNGIRPDANLGRESLQQVIDSQGNWTPTGRVAMPEKKKGTAWVKTERTGTERLVEKARGGNMGCTIASWIFLLAVVALIVFGLHSCGVF